MASLSALEVPEPFWDRYLRAHPLGKPAVVRRPFPSPLTTPEELFQGITLAAADARAGRPNELRLYLGDPKMVYRHTSEYLGDRYWQLLPRPEDGSLGGYAQRLSERHGYACFAIMLNNCQTVMPRLWFRLRDFYSGLFERSGFLRGGTDCNLFAGNYRATPFGAHTDDQDVFTVIVEGRKRLLAWPPKLFQQMEQPLSEDPHNYQRYRARARVLEGKAGDLLYWPKEYGHVAESVDEGLVTTLSLGLNRGSTASPWVREALSEVIGEALSVESAPAPLPFRTSERPRAARSLPRDFAVALKAAQSPRASPRLERALRLRWLGWVTGVGLKPPPEAPAPKLSERDRVQADSSYPILCIPWRGELLVAANGFSVALPSLKGFTALIRALNRGKPLAVGDVLQRFSDRSTRAGTRLLLSKLMAFRAIEKIPAEE
jgi:50S ribosomal protein L16 3-hydroxylase